MAKYLQTADRRPQTADRDVDVLWNFYLIRKVSNIRDPSCFWRKSISWEQYSNLLLQIVMKDWKRVMVLTLFTV